MPKEQKGAASKAFILPTKPQRNAAKITKASANFLPCRIDHDGPIDVHERYWAPTVDPDDGVLTSYFRGRKLRARQLKVPHGHSALFLRKGDATQKDHSLVELASAELEAKRSEMDPATYAEEEAELRAVIARGDLKAEDVHVLDKVAEVDMINLWGHDHVPEENGILERGINEWIAVAAAVSSLHAECFTLEAALIK